LQLVLVAALGSAAGPASQPAPPVPANPPAAVVGAKPAIDKDGGGEFVVQPPKTDISASLAEVERMKATTSSQAEVATFKNVEEIFNAKIEQGNLSLDLRSLRAISELGQLKIGGNSEDAAKTTWTFLQRGGGRIPMLMVMRYDWDQRAEGQIWSVQLTSRQDSFIQVQAREIGGHYIDFRQWQGGVYLGRWFLNPRMGMQMKFTAQAQTLLALKQDHPNEVRQFLEPVLRRLTGKNLLRPGAADLYSVFSDIPADAKITKEVMDLLPALDADAIEKRQAASVDLAKLGGGGVLAVLRMDMTPLSEEQKARCRAFVNAYRRSGVDDDADHLRHDPFFLLDAMEDDDAAVRTEARNQLQNVLGHGVNFDVLADQEARLKAMEPLRQGVEKELADKAAATQPKDPNNAAEPANGPTGAN
jgi:hypothetical protein